MSGAKLRRQMRETVRLLERRSLSSRDRGMSMWGRIHRSKVSSHYRSIIYRWFPRFTITQFTMAILIKYFVVSSNLSWFMYGLYWTFVNNEHFKLWCHYFCFRCNQTCPHGWFGRDCSQMCTCQNGGVCHFQNGYCDCAPGNYLHRTLNPEHDFFQLD